MVMRFALIVMILILSQLTLANEPVNLLNLQQGRLLQRDLLPQDKAVLDLLTDGDLSLSDTTMRDGIPQLEYIFEFSEIVSAQQLVVHLTGSNDPQNRFEVALLMSNISADAGFQSLRDAVIDAGRSNWTFDFNPVAGRWLLLKIIPADTSASLPIAEIEVIGRTGEPQSSYSFDQSPVDAIALLSKLDTSIGFTFDDYEQTLFKDAEDGRLDDWSFAEAALLASGIESASDRNKYIEQIDQLEDQLIQSIPQSGSAHDKGQMLLSLLHQNAFESGYQFEQTDLSTVLSDGSYNCVSSAVLYNILAKRIGLDARGIEVPDHALSIVYDGVNHADVETTTEHGFNPSRNRQAQQAFQEKTGFAYIPERHADKRRELNEMGMVALIYYNHGVTYSQQGDYYQSLLANFRALSLDPENLSAVKNALASLSSWSLQLAKNKQYEKAVSLLELGLKLAPEDRSLKHNFKAVWQRYINQSIDINSADQTLALIKRANKISSGNDFDSLEAWVFIKQGQQLIEQQQWQQALALVDSGLEQVNSDAVKELERWRTNVVFRWSSNALDNQDWSSAMDILANQTVSASDQYKVDRQLGFITQEWGNELLTNAGLETAEKQMTTLLNQFPQQRYVVDAVRNFIYKILKQLSDSNQFEQAIQKSQFYSHLFQDDTAYHRMVKSLYSQQASSLMSAKDWSKALDVFEQAGRDFPNDSGFKQNIAYSAQEWIEALSKNNPQQAAEVLSGLLLRFDGNHRVKKVAESFVTKTINSLADEGEFSQAIEFTHQQKELMKSPSQFKKMLRYVYYLWSENYFKNKKYNEAVNVYIRAFEDLPDDRQLKQNAIATWHTWAEFHIDQNECKKAIEIYQQGLKHLPNTPLFENNIKYCEQQL